MPSLLNPKPCILIQVLMAAGGAGGSATPSRLQQASSPTPHPSPGLRAPLHGCERTLLSALLAELPACDTAWASPAAVAAALAEGCLSPAVAALDAEGAHSFAVAASEVGRRSRALLYSVLIFHTSCPCRA